MKEVRTPVIQQAWAEAYNELSGIYNPEPPPTGVLYHYTDFAGLDGILKSNALWATYNRVLNDASEQRYAEQMLQEELAQRDPLAAKTISFVDQKHFVACFCESSDLLSMWRAYADKSGGYCLGFDYARLKHHMCWPEPKGGQIHPLLAPVHYDIVPGTIRRFLEHTCVVRGLGAERASWSLPSFLTSMIKHKAFQEEREWRIIALDPPLDLLKFRPGAANIRPYVELYMLLMGKPVCKLPLVSVTYGPTLRPEDHPEEIIGWLLEKNGYSSAKVMPSGVPFRP